MDLEWHKTEQKRDKLRYSKQNKILCNNDLYWASRVTVEEIKWIFNRWPSRIGKHHCSKQKQLLKTKHYKIIYSMAIKIEQIDLNSPNSGWFTIIYYSSIGLSLSSLMMNLHFSDTFVELCAKHGESIDELGIVRFGRARDQRSTTRVQARVRLRRHRQTFAGLQ